MLMRQLWLEFKGLCWLLLVLVNLLLVLLVFCALMAPLLCVNALLDVLDWVAERDWMARQLWVKPRKRPVMLLWGYTFRFVATVNTGWQAADGARLCTSIGFGRGPPLR